MAEALYRKYRPQIFEDVVGQEHIERTIKNAIDRDKVSHAYLFTGPRGTGKTTTARLLAKALLCDKGPTADPDGDCGNCNQIAAGTHPDVYELDAASRTGVENVREEIIGRVHYAPTQGRYKVYIIDEVHMLSTAAFNALLKTLEEPPSHVVFILCTTDPQKVPETIHSRCQRFDFHRISVEAIVSRLGAICVAEDVAFEGEALDLIAYRAEGGMRNALTSLDQLITFSEGKVTLNAAERLLGALDSSNMAEIVIAIGKRDIASCFTWTASYIETGSDLAQFVRDLSEHIRNMYILSLSDSEMVLEVSESTRKELTQELAYYGPDRLARMLGVLGDLSAELRTSTNPRLSFEIALTRMVRPDSDLTLEALAERIEELEMRKPEPVVSSAVMPAADGASSVMVERDQAASEQEAPSQEKKILQGTSNRQASSAQNQGGVAVGASAAEQLKNPAALQRIWHLVLQTIKKEKAAYGVLFLNTKINFDEVNQRLDITFPPENVFAYSAAQKPEVYEAVSKALNQAVGSEVAFQFMQSVGVSQTRGVPHTVPVTEPAVTQSASQTPQIPPTSEQIMTQETSVAESEVPQTSESAQKNENESLDEDTMKDMLIQEYGEGVIFGFVEVPEEEK